MIHWSNKLPEHSGYYIVVTCTPLRRELVHRSYFNVDTGGWSFNNQAFVKYLIENK